MSMNELGKQQSSGAYKSGKTFCVYVLCIMTKMGTMGV